MGLEGLQDHEAAQLPRLAPDANAGRGPQVGHEADPEFLCVSPQGLHAPYQHRLRPGLVGLLVEAAEIVLQALAVGQEAGNTERQVASETADPVGIG